MISSSTPEKNRFQTILLFAIGFYLIYQPNFWGQSGKYVVVLMMGCISIMMAMLLTPQTVLSVFQKLRIIICGYAISALYYCFRASFASTDPRLLQNLILILNVMALVLWLENVRKYLGMNNNQVLIWLLWMVVLQCIIAFIMMMDASVRSAILSRTASGMVDNQFIYSERLYGISSDYTFFTPIYHSIIGVCAIYLGMNVSKKYYLFLPFCLFIILLNGRTGLITLLAGFLVVIVRKMVKNFRGLFQVLELLVIVSIGLALSLNVLKSVQPATYEWITSGFYDSALFIFQGERSGNYSQLAGSFLMTPAGVVPWIFGYGVRVYGGNMENIHFGESDIGYVNDIFMGGLIYTTLLYGSFMLFMGKCAKRFNRQVKESAVAIALILILIVANYKGEAGRSGLVLTIIIFLGYLWSTDNNRLRGDLC